MNSKNTNQSRRNFLKKSVLTGALLPMMHGNLFSLDDTSSASTLKIHIFSKHLQFLNYQDMADAAAEMGFDGVDLTVRPNGHVLPEQVDNDLPAAVEAIRKVGFTPLLMVTAVENAEDATDNKVLEVAAKHGIKYYRMNWFRYPDEKSMPESIELFQQKIKGLSLLNKKLGVTGCYQNHAGSLMGSSMWELWQLLKEAEDENIGVQYDIRHATVEGGLSWQNGLRLIQSRIKTIAIKDFKWEKQNGKWIVRNTPIGEGMVDFKTYFKLLKQYAIQVPVSLHMEYYLGGAEGGGNQLSLNKKEVFKAMKRDLKKVHELWQEA